MKKHIKTDCIYYELFTEIVTYPIQISDNSDEYGIGYGEEPIGEICHKKKENDFDCMNCSNYTRYKNTTSNNDLPW